MFLTRHDANVLFTFPYSNWEARSATLLWAGISLIPKPLWFFAYNIIHRSGEKQGRPWKTYHLTCVRGSCEVDMKWMWGGGGEGGCLTTKSCAINHRAGFFPVLSILWMSGVLAITGVLNEKSSANVDPPPLRPLHIHQMSFSWCVSRPSLFFTILPLPCSILNANPRTK